MSEVRALAATGMLGSGFRDASIETALAWRPDFIGVDAGSTDAGPFYLGSGAWQFGRDAVARDVARLVAARRRAGVPLLIGSAGTSGIDAAVDELLELVEAAVRADGTPVRVAAIYCEPPREMLREALRADRIEPLRPPVALDDATLARAEHVVAMAGTEPLLQALDEGAEIVVAGRCSDASIFAAIPIARGIPPAVAFHAAKVLECGAAATTHRLYPDSLFATLREDAFTVESPNPDFACTPQSVASHGLYETDSPYEVIEPLGALSLREATYHAVGPRRVRVCGSSFAAAARATVKLEGAELVGWQATVVAGVRDPVIVRQIVPWSQDLVVEIQARARELYGAEGERVRVTVRRYGLDAVLGAQEPQAAPAHELGIVIDVLAPSERIARGVAKTAAHIGAHHPVPEWHGLITGLAFPHSPPEVVRGQVYRFTLNHVLVLDDPLAPFRIEVREL